LFLRFKYLAIISALIISGSVSSYQREYVIIFWFFIIDAIREESIQPDKKIQIGTSAKQVFLTAIFNIESN
jgi:hypothetical protein